MKKLLISLFVVAAVSFSACGGSAKTEEKTTEDATEVVAPAEEATLLQQYEVLVNKSIDLAKKIEAGDLSAAAEIVKVQEEMTKFGEDNKEAFEKLTEEEKAEFEKIANKAMEEAK